MELYPPIEPYDSGRLEVGDGNSIYWEVCGNPTGKPAVVVHGGPGSGAGTGSRRLFDPERYRVVLFDQRGCGRSRPHASDPSTDMGVNTTHHLIADMERLREHLRINRWLLHGGSWGSTLILAYAERHPKRVSEIVIAGVTMTRPSETDWLYRGVSRFLPAQWERFRAVADSDEVVRAYARFMEDPDLGVRQRAAAEWVTWEDAVIAHESNGTPGAYGARVDEARLAFVRICTHYFAHDAWLEDGELLWNAHRLRGIPGVLIHGRLDLGSPLTRPGSSSKRGRTQPSSSSTTPATSAATRAAPQYSLQQNASNAKQPSGPTAPWRQLPNTRPAQATTRNTSTRHRQVARLAGPLAYARNFAK